jgi:hypothetical protein
MVKIIVVERVIVSVAEVSEGSALVIVIIPPVVVKSPSISVY